MVIATIKERNNVDLFPNSNNFCCSDIQCFDGILTGHLFYASRYNTGKMVSLRRSSATAAPVVGLASSFLARPALLPSLAHLSRPLQRRPASFGQLPVAGRRAPSHLIGSTPS